MSVLEVVPHKVSAVHEKMPVRVWSEAGLYAWAVANQNMALDVNLIRGAGDPVTANTPVYSSAELGYPQELDIVYRGDSTGVSVCRGYPITNLVPNATYALMIDRFQAIKSAGAAFNAGGRVTLVADWTEGDSRRTQDQDSAGGKIVEWTAANLPTQTDDIEPRPAGILNIGSAATGLGWSNRNGLRVYPNMRHAKGAPQGFVFGVGSAPVGAGLTVNISHSELGNKQSHEVLFTTHSANYSTEQVIFGVPYTSRTGWAIRAYITSGILYISIRGKIYNLGSVGLSTTYHLVVAHDNSNPSGESNGTARILLNGVVAVEDNTAQTGVADTDRIVVGVNSTSMLNGSSTTYYFRGTVHHFRTFNKTLSKTAALKLWNNGEPWNYVMPWADGARPISVVGATYAYGCCLELLAHNYRANAEFDYLYSSAPNPWNRAIQARSMNWGTSARIVAHSFYSPEYKTSYSAITPPYSVRTQNIMFQQYLGDLLPFRLAPPDLISSLNAYDYTIDPIKVTAYRGVDDIVILKTATLERPAGPQGYAEVDLSGILKHAFLHEEHEVNHSNRYDFNLWGEYDIKVGATTTPRKQFIRQVQQYGYRRDLTTEPLGALITMPLRYYQGYPLGIAIFNPLTGIKRVYAGVAKKDEETAIANTQTSLAVQVFNVVISMDIVGIPFELQVRYSPDSWESSVRYPFVGMCTPENPFYIRWINHLGGWDYKMFGNRQYVEDVVTDLTNIQTPQIGDDEYHLQETINLAAYQYVRVGDANLPLNEFDALRLLARSPRIEWWNEDVQRWYSVTLSKEITLKSKTDDALGSIELTFQMPRIRVQF